MAHNGEFDTSRRSGGNLVAHGFSRGMTYRRTCEVPEARQICRASGTYTRRESDPTAKAVGYRIAAATAAAAAAAGIEFTVTCPCGL